MIEASAPWLAVVLGWFFASGAPAPPPAPTDPPIPIVESAPTAPPEAKGASVSPTASIVLHLDRRGKPVRVEVVKLEPSSPLDDAFARAATENALKWRFAPALRDGTPVESRVERRVHFLPAPATTFSPSPDGPWSPFRPGAMDELEKALWSHVLSLPPREREQMREKLSASAEKLMTAARRTHATTDHLEVITDIPGAEVAQTIGQNLEVSFATVFDLLKSHLGPQPSGRTRVYAFASRDAFHEFLKECGGSPSGAGAYHPSGVLALHVELGTSEAITQVLIHEGVHAFLDAYILRPGVRLPLWLNEGLAEYVSNSEIRKGQILPGRHAKSAIYRDTWNVWLGQSTAQMDLASVKKAIRSGEAPPLPRLLAAGHDEFYGDNARFYYAEAWLLVHFLRHGRPGWAEGSFPQLFLYAAEGFSGPDLFRELYGATVEDLAGEFLEYVKDF